MAILTPQTLGAVFNGTAYNNNLLAIEASVLDIGPFIVSGLVPSAGTGLSVNVTAGTASIGMQVVKASTWTISGLSPSTTNHLYLLNTGAGTSNTTGTAPANSVKLGTALTDGTGVLSVDTSITSGRQTKVAPNVFLKDSDQTLSDGTDIAVGTSTGTKLATSTAQRLGFFNATPIVQPANTTDLRTALINLGLLAGGGATPLNLNGGMLTASGSGNSLGATSLTGTLTLSAQNIATDTTTGMQVATSSSQKLGFFGATPVVQPGALTQTFSTADATLSAYTSDPESSSYSGIDNAQGGTPYATVADLNQLRVAYETLRVHAEDLAQFVNSLVDKLQSLGLVG